MNASNSERLPFPKDKWDGRFGWFWYNDQEIFHDGEGDIDAKVKKFADEGINHLITFSCTHFRWSFRRHWPLLTETLATIARCCHRHGVYVTEHHSAVLTHDVSDENSKDYLGRVLKVRKSSVESWPGLIDDCESDPMINGVRLSSMRQVQGSDSSYSKTPYKSMILCPNNPNYRKAYFDYLESLYAVGIDGIMTDDLHFFGEGCACPQCRALFKEKHGHVMPESGEDWKRWHGNYDNPSFREWLHFRYRSMEDFHLAVDNHYESLGLRLLRPDYQSHCLNSNPTASCLENKPTLGWVFQEACFSHVIRYSWIHFLIEQSHRQMVARQRDIPHMIMFYPDREDSMRFSWGLAKYCGALFTGTPEGKKIDFSEKKLRQFEDLHKSALFGTTKLADIAFFDSKRNRELDKDFWHLSGLNFWIQACVMDNLQFELVQADEADRLRDFKVIALVKHALLSDDEVKLLKRYVREGGVLMFYQKAGVLDYSGARRDEARLRKLWGFDFPEASDFNDDVIETSCDKGQYVFVGDEVGKSVNFIERDGTERENTSDYMFNVTVDRWTETAKPLVYDGKYAKLHDKQEALSNLLNGYLGDGISIKLSNVPEGVLASAFSLDGENELAVHVVNAVNCFDVPEGTPLSHADEIPFPDLTPYGTAAIAVLIPQSMTKTLQGQCVFHSLDHLDGSPLDVETSSTRVTISLPLNLLKDYGLIRIR